MTMPNKNQAILLMFFATLFVAIFYFWSSKPPSEIRLPANLNAEKHANPKGYYIAEFHDTANDIRIRVTYGPSGRLLNRIVYDSGGMSPYEEYYGENGQIESSGGYDLQNASNYKANPNFYHHPDYNTLDPNYDSEGGLIHQESSNHEKNKSSSTDTRGGAEETINSDARGPEKPMLDSVLAAIPRQCWTEIKNFCQTNLTFLSNQVLPVYKSGRSREFDFPYSIGNCTFKNVLTIKNGVIQGAHSLDDREISYTSIQEKGNSNALEVKIIPFKKMIALMENQCTGHLLRTTLKNRTLERLPSGRTNLTDDMSFFVFRAFLRKPVRDSLGSELIERTIPNVEQ